MALLILELTQGGRGPQQYIKVERLPFTIGRGYDNDLILADDSLCARHLLLTQDECGQPVAVNRSSVNGSRINGQPLTNQPLPLPLPTRIELGPYQLRLLSPDMRLPAATASNPQQQLWQAGRRWPLAAGSLLLLLLLELASSMTDLDFGRSWQNWLLSAVNLLLLPLAIAGGVMALALVNLFTPQSLDLLTMIGFIILLGLVVNNAILLVDQTRSGEREGLTRTDAVRQAILLRARPVYMSTLTSLFGMLPLMLIPGVGAEIYRGLATVIVGGMAISALFTLILLPAVLQMQRPVSMRIRSATVAAQGNSHV